LIVDFIPRMVVTVTLLASKRSTPLTGCQRIERATL
jgi:hypothetical protein